MNFATSIDPKWGQWLNVLAFFLSGLAMAGWWQDFMTPQHAAAAVGLTNLVVSTLNFVLHGMPGPTDYRAIAKAAVVVLVIVGALFSSGQAFAQARNNQPVFRPTVPTGNLPADLKKSFTPDPVTKDGDVGLTGDPIKDLHAAIKQGGAKLIVHLKMTYALAQAKGADGAPVDPTSAPCAKALVPIVDLVVNGPKAGTVDASDPMALTADEEVMASNTSEPEGIPVKIEKARIIRLALQSPALNIACGALVQDEVKQGANLIGKITGLITGAGVLSIVP